MKKIITGLFLVILSIFLIGCTESSTEDNDTTKSNSVNLKNISPPKEELEIENSPDCLIKGNVSYNTGEKIYHMPGDEYYDETKINEAYGEEWFCTPEEAEAAGFRRAYN